MRNDLKRNSGFYYVIVIFSIVEDVFVKDVSVIYYVYQVVNVFLIYLNDQDYCHQQGETKRLSEHLKLPIQRINDYQVLIQVT